MPHDRLIQLSAACLALAGAVGAGTLLPRLNEIATDHQLRYTDEVLDGAPPIVQIGTAIGAVRGIIVDYLWLKIIAMKQKGLFYEVMSDADLITRLQPRFAEVWAFHGHNMAYNISVITDTPEERWDWVQQGVNLVRNKGLRFNPNNVVLHKELAFFFAHKIDGVADDAHFYYKKEFTREWHLLLGDPPPSHADRVAWIKKIADAPDTLEECVKGRPAVVAPIEFLRLARIEVEQSDKALEDRDRTLERIRQLAREWTSEPKLPDLALQEIARTVQIAATLEDAMVVLDQLMEAGGELLPAIAPTPEVEAMVDRLTAGLSGFDRKFEFALDGRFLRMWGEFAAMRTSPYAQLLRLDSQLRAQSPVYRAFGEIAEDPAVAKAWNAFLPFLRKKVLADEYNMSARSMYEYTRDIGPLDWRHPQAHALYWSRRGQQYGESRYQDTESIYKIVNNDRVFNQSMQAMAWSGIILFDPFSGDNPARLNDVRWIKAVDNYFWPVYFKHLHTRGGARDTFCTSHENFISRGIVALYRAGDTGGAEHLLERLDQLYGRGLEIAPNMKFAVPLETFVRDTTYAEYEQQPDVARTDVYAALRQGFREGLLLGRPEALESAIKFAAEVTEYFQNTRYAAFENKFGVGRLRDLIGTLRESARQVFIDVLLDRSMPLYDRLHIYNLAPERYRVQVYDAARAPLQEEFERSTLAQVTPFANAFPEPPGIDVWRARRAEQEAIEAQRQHAAPVERK